jgi:hypothetical protein
VAIVSKTARAGSLGIWPELTGLIYDEWASAGIASDLASFGYSRRPTLDSLTRIRNFSIWNRHGGQSDVMLFPIERSSDAFEKLLSTQFSLIWISEAHQYEDRRIFDVSRGQLRLMGVPYRETGLLCDCNPPTDGVAHWLYEVFYTERQLSESEFPPEWDEETKKAVKRKQAEMDVFEFALDENPFLDDGMKASFRATYARNPAEYDRLVRGLWVGNGGALGCFSQDFKYNLHVMGNADSKDESDWEVLLPSTGAGFHVQDGRPLLLGGWDLGGGVNHSWHAIQPYSHMGEAHFNVVDELVVTNERISVSEFTERTMKRMADLERFGEISPTWVHYSDASAMDFRASIRHGEAPSDVDNTDAGIVEDVSKGGIELIGAGAVKRGGWQRRRVELLQELLRQNRLHVSAHCKRTIEMFRGLKVNASKVSGYILPGQTEKHAFDSLSYALAMYCVVEMDREAPLPRRRKFST